MVAPPVQIGSYRIERLLGIGSFATVWLGYDASLGAHVAIKVLAENWSHDLRVRERFLDEARLLWRIDDPRVVRVHALGELDDGRPYLVMAWAEGGSLQDRLAGDPMPVTEAVALLREICAGVGVLHEQGVVHRDLTPGNVLFAGGRAVIADLGLAKALAAASGLTARAGTPGYMAPEQDDPMAVVDRRCDVYGLGRLGIRLLGVPGRSGEPIRWREGVPRAVAEVLRTAAATRPEKRFPDASTLGAALDAATAVRRRAATRTVLSLLSIGLGAVLASDTITGRFTAEPGLAVDPTGQIAVRLPAEWVTAGAQFVYRPAGVGPGSAMVVSPDPARWSRDPALPGAFIWLAPRGATEITAARFVAARPHADCVAAPPRTSRQAGRVWLVARYRDCSDGRAEVVEAVGTRPGHAALVYVQVTPPAGGPPAFVDTLLAGIRVR